MKRIKFHLNVDLPGTAHEDIIEFDDDASEEEIEEAYQDSIIPRSKANGDC